MIGGRWHRQAEPKNQLEERMVRIETRIAVEPEIMVRAVLDLL